MLKSAEPIMSLSAVEARLEQIMKMQDTVMTAVMEFAETLPDQLETFNEAIDTASDTIDTIASELEADTMQLETLSTTAAETSDSAMQVAADSVVVEENLAKTEIKSDLYWIQDSTKDDYAPLELMTQQGWNEIPQGCFKVDTAGFESNVIVEFFLSATINSSADGVQATKIRLVKDGVPVALAVSSDNETEGENYSPNFSVFYKVVQEADMEVDYDIEIF